MATNLLPIAYRGMLKKEQYRKVLIVGGAYISFTLIVWIVLLLPSFIFLYYQTAAVNNTPDDVSNAAVEARALQREIGAYNRAIAVLSSRSTTGIGAILRDVTNIDLTDVYFTALTIDKEALEAQLDGVAKNRATLERMVAELSAHEQIESATAPVENFLGNTDLRFTISIAFKPYE